MTKKEHDLQMQLDAARDEVKSLEIQLSGAKHAGRLYRDAEAPYIVNFWDVDGTMVVHQFPDGKMNADITKDSPFPWVHDKVRQGDVNVMVSGRGSELKDITLQWWRQQSAAVPPMYYKGVDWDTKDASEQRMLNYVERKRLVLKELLAKWGNALEASGIRFELRVYEDDKSVLSGTSSKWDEFTKTYLVENGNPPQPYGFHDWIKEHQRTP
jgi:hypothetical protein